MPDPKPLPKPRAILFDWDNTLVDTWPCITRVTNITLETMGLAAWSEQEARERIAGSLRDTFPAIYGDRWEQARDVFYKAFDAVHLEALKAAEGAEDMLRAGHMNGIYLGVVSNKTGKYLRVEAEHLRWTSLFGRLVGAQDAARDKPAADPIHLALEQSGILAGPDVWYVGDAPIDVVCGRAAGCTTVVLGKAAESRSVTTHPDFALADRIVADCAAFSGLVRSSV